MANQTLLEFTEKTLVADADWVFVWDTAGAISKKVSRNGLLNSGTLATSAPVTISQTWDALAVAFTALKVNATSTNSAAASLLLDLQVGGTTKLKISKNGMLSHTDTSGNLVGFYSNNNNTYFVASDSSSDKVMGLNHGNSILFLNSSGALAWTNQARGAFNESTYADTILVRDSASGNTLALRNGINPQTFRVYNTFPGTGNNEYAEIAWVGNFLLIRPAASGTATVRGSVFGSGSSETYLDGSVTNFRSASLIRWSINSSGHFLAGTDNTCDIGASGANRPRNVYVGTSVIAGGYQVAPGGGIQNSAGTGANLSFIAGNSRLAFDLGGGVFWSDSINNPIAAATVAVRRNATGVLEVNSSTLGDFRDLRVRSVIQQPPASITPASNGDYVVEATSNTTLTFKLKGTDGTVRTATLTLA